MLGRMVLRILPFLLLTQIIITAPNIGSSPIHPKDLTSNIRECSAPMIEATTELYNHYWMTLKFHQAGS